MNDNGWRIVDVEADGEDTHPSVLMFLKGLTPREIARSLNISYMKVRTHIKNAGLDFKRTDHELLAKARHLYVEQMLTLSETARECGVDCDKIRRWGIKGGWLRTKSETAKLPKRTVIDDKKDKLVAFYIARGRRPSKSDADEAPLRWFENRIVKTDPEWLALARKKCNICSNSWDAKW